ncbi:MULTISPECIES: NAD(P)/FAD-dependent oxidoreductase [unclassified Arthrobacter]|uniref:FAD-dependent oxidoreductase n=1 Tax=unclassified Arthrobacter TaxID=235627 RepID=UPI001E5CE29D|nr:MULTISPECIES: NAD(P)/FAD-dependent oxidoreductase [unclassified Arthrobacter]MCC9145872.1 FAD-dependent monooxygenase [Arthrobacter sp. zg-Y919]MDK1277101.1 NAD(P)/FAD-dependent oxidoreductase [Arthrobacter sp. zg.Y919]WIB03624.1 NAD(P)/FAD-dependent oxidoreductase [Arthrobacter sp. zg-Y919]
MPADLPRRSTDVVVAGGGPVGLYLACLLLQAGVSVQVLEQRPSRSSHSRAIGVHPPALESLAQAGIGDAMIREGVRITHGEARSAGRTVARLDFAAASDRYPFVLTLPQVRTEHLLEERLRALDPGALVRGSKVESFDDLGSSVRVYGTSEGQPFITQAALLVAADGARSGIRSALGTRWSARDLPDTYVMGDYPDGTGDGALAVLYLEPEGIVESFPLPGGLRRWVAHTGALPQEATAAGLAQLVRRRTGHRLDVAGNSMLSAFGVRIGRAHHLVHGRTVLIGDAAHQISPIGGQGMNLGWLDAAAVAPLIAASLHGKPMGRALQDFERRRRRGAVVASAQARANMVLGRPLPQRAMALRNAGLERMFRVPALGGAVARRFTMQ